MMKNRILRLTAALAAAFCLLLSPALAEERTGPETPVKAEPSEWSPSETAQDNDALFAAYIDQCFYGNAAKPLRDPEGDRLTGLDQKLYDVLKGSIKATAESGGSAAFSIPCSRLGIKTTWTSEDVGGRPIFTGGALDPDTAAAVSEAIAFHAQSVLSALLSDFSCELYWFDRTAAPAVVYSSPKLLAFASTEGKPAAIQLDGDFRFVFAIAPGYQESGGLTVKPDAAAVKTAVKNAQTIISAHKDKNDYQKLAAFKEELCALAGTGGKAVSGGTFGGLRQMALALGGDPGTAASCEGYAKAFQYLCDVSGLRNAECYTISGLMQENGAIPKPHMWNIVRMGGKNYLVDIAGSLDGGIGRSGGLFLAGAEVYEETDPPGYMVSLPSGPVCYWYEHDLSERLDKSALALSETGYDPRAELAYDALIEPAFTAANTAGLGSVCLLAVCGDAARLLASNAQTKDGSSMEAAPLLSAIRRFVQLFFAG